MLDAVLSTWVGVGLLGTSGCPSPTKQEHILHEDLSLSEYIRRRWLRTVINHELGNNLFSIRHVVVITCIKTRLGFCLYCICNNVGCKCYCC